MSNKSNDRGKTLTRRGALKLGGGAAVAAIGAPWIVPASALGKDGETAPSNRINIGLVGMGLMMNGHHRTMLSRKDTQVLAVCDVVAKKREDSKKFTERHYSSKKKGGDYKGCEAYNEYEKIVERDDIDAVMVVTPDHWHAPISLAAMRSGKDVYCQKPMTLTIAEGRLMADVAAQYGALLQVGSQQRSDRAFRTACQLVRNGYIGKVEKAYARLGQFPPPSALFEELVPTGFDYDRWLGPTPWYPFNSQRVKGNYGGGWRRYWEYGSRKNGDWGAHHFDIIQWALGMDESGPVEFTPKGYKGAQYQQHRYKDGVTVYRDHPTRKSHMIEIVGSKGSVMVSRGDKLDTDPPGLKQMDFSPKDERLYKSRDHQANWIECIKTRRPPICPAEIGHRTATICHLSGIAERLGRPIRWDPEKEEIVGDPAASRWIERPRRAPYVNL